MAARPAPVAPARDGGGLPWWPFAAGVAVGAFVWAARRRRIVGRAAQADL
jgi:hypothetical protein